MTAPSSTEPVTETGETDTLADQCLGCDTPITAQRYDAHQGVCPDCETALAAGRRVKNSGGDPYAGRGLRSDPFVY